MADSYQHSTESRFAQAALNFLAKDKFPVELVCPITQTLMQDPVLTVQGNVYERASHNAKSTRGSCTHLN